MKRKLNIISSLFTGLCISLTVSCDEELPRQAKYEAYEFSGLDEDGGTWVPVLLASPDQVVIEVPDATTSTEYQTKQRT